MKKKLAITLIMTMITVGITACGASDNTSANDSVKDTEQVAVADTEIVETEEPAELVESTEQTSTTELVATGSVQTASNDKEAPDTAKSSTDTKKSASDAGNSSTSTASTTKGGADTKSATSNNSTNAGTSNTSTTAATTSTNTSTQQTASNTTHEHVWVEHLATGHYEDQVVTEAYDEPVYEYKNICNKCGTELPNEEAIAIHYGFDCDGSYSNVKVQTGSIHHDAVTQSVWVEDSAGWYECSVCGEKSILASHNHN